MAHKRTRVSNAFRKQYFFVFSAINVIRNHDFHSSPRKQKPLTRLRKSDCLSGVTYPSSLLSMVPVSPCGMRKARMLTVSLNISLRRSRSALRGSHKAASFLVKSSMRWTVFAIRGKRSSSARILWGKKEPWRHRSGTSNSMRPTTPQMILFFLRCEGFYPSIVGAVWKIYIRKL